MDGLKTVWTVLYALGLASFSVLVLVTIPLGARDLRQLFRDLKAAGRDQAAPETQKTEDPSA